MKENKKKIFWLSDSPFLNTGFSSQSLFTINGLVDTGKYEVVYQVGNNYTGQSLSPNNVKLDDGTPFKFTLHGIGKLPYAHDLIVPRIREYKSDFFITLLDTFMMFPYYLQQDFAPAKTIFWFPTDGNEGLPKDCEQILKKVHYPVAMSKHGQKQVLDLYGIKADYIPHGVDHNKFYPLKEEEELKIRQKFGLAGKYVVGLMGRNQGRKMHDGAIRAFAKWCKPHPEAVLFIHADPDDAAQGFDMLHLINKLQIQNRVVFSGTRYYKGFTYEQMNEVYNVMDIYLSSTSGEGFGVGTIEAMSCEIPCLLPAFTTTDELVTNNKAGFPIKLKGCDYLNVFDVPTQEYDEKMVNGTIIGAWNVGRGLMDIHDCVEKLEMLYQNKELREECGKNGRKTVLKEYTWEHIIKKWDDLLTKIGNEN